MFGMPYQFISIIINSCIFFIVLSTLVNSYLLLSSSSRLSLLSPILSITMFYIFIALSSDSGYNEVASISFWILFFIFPLYLSLMRNSQPSTSMLILVMPLPDTEEQQQQPKQCFEHMKIFERDPLSGRALFRFLSFSSCLRFHIAFGNITYNKCCTHGYTDTKRKPETKTKTNHNKNLHAFVHMQRKKNWKLNWPKAYTFLGREKCR